MNPTKKMNILIVPVDFKKECILAIKYAKELAPIINGQIHLLNVLDANSDWDSDNKPEKLMNEKFNKLVELSRKYELPLNTFYRVELGKQHQKIVEYANSVKARYIIMADNYPETTENKKLGSTLSNVIITATQPVIIAKKIPHTIFKNILVPLDLNQDCRLKLFNSISLALQHGAKINIVSVVFGDSSTSEKLVNDKIESFSRLYTENQIPFTTKIFYKSDELAYRTILDYTHDLKCDSLLIMTHRENTGIDNYLGKFAHHIINEARIPVISLNNASSTKAKKSLINAFIDPINIFKLQ